jgi:hypothetical protein
VIDDSTTEPDHRTSLSRRSIVRAGLWSLPVVAVAVATPAAAASGPVELPLIRGEASPWSTYLALDEPGDLVVTFIETGGVDFTGTVSILIMPSRARDTVVASMTAFGDITSTDSDGTWTYVTQGNNLLVTYAGFIEASIGVSGTLYAVDGAGFRVDTGGHYLSTRLSSTVLVNSTEATVDGRPYSWDMEYGVDAPDSPY